MRNDGAMKKALDALRKGMGQAFLQSSVNRDLVKHAVSVGNGVLPMEKDMVLSFLDNPFGDYAAQSGEIVGYLSQMLDRMNADCDELREAEAAAVKSFNELMAAKKEEVALATKEIEQKIEKAGKVAVETAQKQGELEENGRSMEADREFLANLEKNCKDQKAAYEERVKMRNEELAAVSEAVKILNDDDARDIFKKTLPADQPVAASFLQRQETPQQEALELVQAAADASAMNRPRLSLLAYMLKSGSVDFTKVIKMIQDMRELLKKEQKSDDDSLAYCKSELKTANDNKAEFERNVKTITADIENHHARIEELKASIDSLKERIAQTNKMMKEATADRKDENAEYQENMATSTASIQIMKKALNILNKIYNPAAYTTPKPRELTEEQRILQASGGTLATEAPQFIRGTQIRLNLSQRDPGPAPEVATYERKQGSGSGVTTLIGKMITDVESQMNQMKLEENEAQKDYEELMQKSEASVKADTEAKTQAENALAQTQTDLNQSKEDLTAKKDELAKEIETIAALHGDCDFLMANFDARKAARADEDDALSRAASILQGAKGDDYKM